MIDFEYYISLYCDKKTDGHPFFGFSSERIKTERTEHNHAVAYLYPSEKETDISAFLAAVNDLLHCFLRDEAYPALYGFLKTCLPETAAELKEVLLFGKDSQDGEVLPDYALLHQCLLEAARYARQNGLWEQLEDTAPMDWEAVYTNGLSPLLKNAANRPGAFLMALFGIEEQVFHINIGYQYQCNFEMSAETMAEIAKMGLIFTFSCYEQEIEPQTESGAEA